MQPRATNVVVRLKCAGKPMAARSSAPNRHAAEDKDDVGEWAQQIVVVAWHRGFVVVGWQGRLLEGEDVRFCLRCCCCCCCCAGGSCGARTNQTTVIFVVALPAFYLPFCCCFTFFFLTFGLFVMCERASVCVCVCVRAYESVSMLPNGGWLPKLTTIEGAIERELN